ncbi:MAG TPA: UDP-N-acetylmuramoyl-tripeptide--D-alanyl-D-alanine ligase [Tenuifilaceae bacterium]|nr:UDP-N-acetylmuramoyl-tripeptide--D-alanyl-D-alanine ligase [Tenuifilaceae bacterium]
MLEKLYHHYLNHGSVATDSRSIPKGAIFFGLKGDKFDGNKFAEQALNNGASLAVIDNPTFMTHDCILVENTLKTLQELANHHRKQLKAKIIGITGTNGKTTTKELIQCVLSKKYHAVATKGNLNNQIGVPLTLLSLTADVEVAIVEMGASHPGDIAELASIAAPDIGIITNIGKAHLEGFGSYEGVVRTKGELYDYIARHKGLIIYNQHNEVLKQLVMGIGIANKLEYSNYCKSIKVTNQHDTPFISVNVEMAGTDKPMDIKTKLVGSYNIENIEAAIAVGLHFGVKPELIKNAIEEYNPSNSRSQLIQTKRNTVIMDAYNANPTSMEAAVRNFISLESPNKIIILGEMLELGSYAESEHKKVVKLLESLGATQVFLIGQNFSGINSSYGWFADAKACAEYFLSHEVANATILLKGSRGVGLERVLDVL